MNHKNKTEFNQILRKLNPIPRITNQIVKKKHNKSPQSKSHKQIKLYNNPLWIQHKLQKTQIILKNPKLKLPQNQRQKLPRKNLSKWVNLWYNIKLKQKNIKLKHNKLSLNTQDTIDSRFNNIRRFFINFKNRKNTWNKNRKSETICNQLFTD